MPISNERIQQNHDEFISLLSQIQREGANIEKLITKLEHSDFFIAPASAKYHSAFPGGLAEHCLNVYYNLKHLVKYKEPLIGENTISEDSIIITALLHDLSKMNYYEKCAYNKKQYTPQGSKKDELGSFDWVTEEGFKTKDVKSRFLYGNHEMNSEYMIRQFIPLTMEESIAILHHMGAMSFDCAKDDISAIFSKYPLALLLHLADMAATYVEESIQE